MEYTTAEGHRLRIGRIPRARIDAFGATNPPPEPPTKTVEVWGGLPEKVPDTNDPDYQAALGRYYVEIGRENVKLIAPAVELIDVDLSEIAELGHAGVDSLDNQVAAFLRYMVNDAEVQAIVEQALYNSTVTNRGLMEASQRYNVRWGGGLLTAFSVLGKSAGSYGAEFDARRAAQFNGTRWPEFCEMSGAEQSNVVAFFRLSNSLSWLQSKEARK